MIWLDGTKSARASHFSGLQRVARRLGAALDVDATVVEGTTWAARAHASDWFLTTEVFAPAERSGWTELMATRPCRLAAIFHDAIPMRWPQITWPQSVARHPAYLKMLASFDLVLAVSEASRQELTGYWEWLGLPRVPEVRVIALGADFDDQPRRDSVEPVTPPEILCVAILEPRKNQALLLDVAESLWREGRTFSLHLVGRTNPHFGRPIETRIKELRRDFPGLQAHGKLDEAGLAKLYGRVAFTAFPTLAEGCGLPVLESLWHGVPCLASDIPSVRENAGAGVHLVKPNDRAAWRTAVSEWLDGKAAEARDAIPARTLPTWRETAAQVRAALGVSRPS
ncbi:MAG: hypothetical protein RIS54_1673 [Verrucomicrobiota bacterium]